MCPSVQRPRGDQSNRLEAVSSSIRQGSAYSLDCYVVSFLFSVVVVCVCLLCVCVLGFLGQLSPSLAARAAPPAPPSTPVPLFAPLPTCFSRCPCIPERFIETLCALFKRHPILSTARLLTVGLPTFGPLRGRTFTADWPVTVQVWPRPRSVTGQTMSKLSSVFSLDLR